MEIVSGCGLLSIIKYSLVPFHLYPPLPSSFKTVWQVVPEFPFLIRSELDPRNCQYDFNTVESMDVWGCESVVTLRDSMKVWNKAVQYWVAMVVYKRFPVKPLK